MNAFQQQTPYLSGFVVLLSALTLRASSAPSSTPIELVKQAINAEDGIDALRGLKALTIHSKDWETGQSLAPGGEPRATDSGVMTMVWDLDHGMARMVWGRDRSIKYPVVSQEKPSEILPPTAGGDPRGRGVKPLSGIRLATHLRELERASPFLPKAFNSPNNFSAFPDQTLGNKSYSAISFTDGPARFIILFDRATHLPAGICTLDDDILFGGSQYDLILSDWQPAGGVKIARSLTYMPGSVQTSNVTYKNAAVINAVPPRTFVISDEVRRSAKPPATGQASYQ